MAAETRSACVSWAYETLRATGRGKHVGPFSYYHLDVVQHLESVHALLDRICHDFARDSFDYNVIKLNRVSPVSFLRYEAFTAAFPALLASLSCNVATGTATVADYTRRRNPPILHRKELLLPAGDPLTQAGARLTACLEARGAFADGRRIGTRDGWAGALARLGLAVDNGQVVGW